MPESTVATCRVCETAWNIQACNTPQLSEPHHIHHLAHEITDVRITMQERDRAVSESKY